MIFIPTEEEIKSKIKIHVYKNPNYSNLFSRLYEYSDDVVGYKSVTDELGNFSPEDKVDELVKKVQNAYYEKRYGPFESLRNDLVDSIAMAAQIPKQMLMPSTIHIPDKKKIRDSIKVYEDLDINRDMIILVAVYKDNVVGEVKARDEIPYPRSYDLRNPHSGYYEQVKDMLTYEVLQKYEDMNKKGENKEMDFDRWCDYMDVMDAHFDNGGWPILKSRYTPIQSCTTKANRNDETVADVFNTLSEKQKQAVDFIVGKALKNQNGSNDNKEAKNMMKPTIAKIEFYNDRVTKVTWKDGSFTKSVCGENDVFNKDIGVTICLIKKMLGGQKKGTNAYMKFLKDAKNILENQEKEKTAEDEAKQIEKEKQKKNALRIAKRKQKKEQAQIDIQKAAFVAAMREIEGERKQCMCQKSEKASANKTLKKECKK